MEDFKKRLKRLFFYSSRQLIRRKRSYLSIFLTSVILLSLVMTFLEMAETYFLRDIEESESGYYHAIYRESPNDYTKDFLADSRIESAWSIPYTSLLASSDDASAPGRVVVPTEEITEKLDVRYVWGKEPGDGEIAVSTDLYNAYGYLMAGVENELFFKATEMTYFPLTVSGIFEANDKDAGYVFVTQSTADAIAKETHAKVKYDLYFRAAYASDRNVGIILDEYFQTYRLTDTDWQLRIQTGDPNRIYEFRDEIANYRVLFKKYEDYINFDYLDYLKEQSATPLIAISMPVIAIAALMMATFMANWVTSNSEEYGILGAIGANRRQICAISAGQILLIGLIASVPVVLLSAGISNIYISAFNAASSTDVDFVFTVPWQKLIEAALWWCLLACFFTYLGIARITREMPFVLISGQAKYKIPFVSRSSEKLARAKDKILALSFLKSRRVIKSKIVSSVITALVSIVCGVFLILLIMLRSGVSSAIGEFQKYTSDFTVTEKSEINSYGREVSIHTALAEELAGEALIERVGLYDHIDGSDYLARVSSTDMEPGDAIVQHYPYEKVENDPNWSGDYRSSAVITVDRTALDMASYTVLEGDPTRIFENPSEIVAIVSPYQGNKAKVGDTIKLSGTRTVRMNSDGQRSYSYSDTYDYKVCAVIMPVGTYADLKLTAFTYMMSDEGRQLCGLEGGEWTKILADFSADATEAQMKEVYTSIVHSPAFLRYDLVAHEIMTDVQERIQLSTTLMLYFFFFMVYLSFCTMTYTESLLKVTKERREIAILRQIGADDRAIYKSMRSETYIAAILALCIVLAVVIIAPTAYWISETVFYRNLGDFENFPPEALDEILSEVNETAGMIFTLLIPSIPVCLLSTGVTMLGTYLPTKRILNDTIADGIRKDTD